MDELEQGAVAPGILEEELYDLGPQYLLLPGTPPHDWFRALLDTQLLSTSNPTLADESLSESSDLFILTAQFGLATPAKTIFGGQLDTHSGLRYQTFRYGLISGNDVIGGLPVRDNDFDAYTVFSDTFWRYEDWTLRLGLRWTELENDLSGRGFYTEFVPSWGISKNVVLGENSLLVFAYDGAWFISENDTFSFIRDDLNDRISNSLKASLIHRFNSELYVEPYARITYSVYSNEPSGDREDTTLNLGVTMSYYIRDNIALRLFANYQDRSSTGVGIADYENFDLGLGSSLSFSF